MAEESRKRRPFALITGASSGIGAAFADRYARAGYDLALVARNAPALEEVAHSVRRRRRVNAVCLVQDLTEPDAGERIAFHLGELGIEVDVLVNNAGVAASGPFARSDRQSVVDTLDVNTRALTALTHTFLPGMIKRRHGRILNVAAVAAFVPVPALSVYAATKAYVLSFTEALSEELRGTGVTATALCPGLTRTPMAERLRTSREWPGALMLAPSEVAREGFDAAENGEVIRIPGIANQATVFWARLQPRSVVRSVNGFISRFAMDF